MCPQGGYRCTRKGVIDPRPDVEAIEADPHRGPPSSRNGSESVTGTRREAVSRGPLDRLAGPVPAESNRPVPVALGRLATPMTTDSALGVMAVLGRGRWGAGGCFGLACGALVGFAGGGAPAWLAGAPGGVRASWSTCRFRGTGWCCCWRPCGSARPSRAGPGRRSRTCGTCCGCSTFSFPLLSPGWPSSADWAGSGFPSSLLGLMTQVYRGLAIHGKGSSRNTCGNLGSAPWT